MELVFGGSPCSLVLVEGTNPTREKRSNPPNITILGFGPGNKLVIFIVFLDMMGWTMVIHKVVDRSQVIVDGEDYLWYRDGSIMSADLVFANHLNPA